MHWLKLDENFIILCLVAHLVTHTLESPSSPSCPPSVTACPALECSSPPWLRLRGSKCRGRWTSSRLSRQLAPRGLTWCPLQWAGGKAGGWGFGRSGEGEWSISHCIVNSSQRLCSMKWNYAWLFYCALLRQPQQEHSVCHHVRILNTPLYIHAIHGNHIYGVGEGLGGCSPQNNCE